MRRAPLALPIAAAKPVGQLVFGVDKTSERPHGTRIVAEGHYRHAVHASKEYFVNAGGLRGACLMLPMPISRAAQA